jgi:uncharacterized protein HemX
MMTKEQDTKTSNILPLLWLLSAFNLLGLGYVIYTTQTQGQVIQDHNHQILDFNNNITQATRNWSEQIEKLTAENTTIQQKLSKAPAPTAGLEHIKWLIQQAKWQVNVLFHPQTAQQLLRLAKDISQQHHWSALEELIDKDIANIDQIHLTPSTTLISQINQLKTSLSAIQPTKTFIKNKADIVDTPLPDYLKLFTPFVKINRIHGSDVNIYSPSDQFQIIENMHLLLSEIQFAGITHQQETFQELVNQFEYEWLMIAEHFPDTQLEKQIETLKNDSFEIAQPVNFESFSEINYLIQQLNTSTP